MFVKPVSTPHVSKNGFISAPILTSYSIHTAEQLEFKARIVAMCSALDRENDL